MRGFTAGSCCGWTGVVTAHSATTRVLDLTIDGDRGESMTIVIAPVAAPPERSQLGLEAEALVEWGSEQGGSQQALVDVGRGVTFGLVAARVIVALRSVGVAAGHPRETEYRASASLGGMNCRFSPMRAVRIGPIPDRALSPHQQVPPFGRRVFVSRSPQSASVLRFFDGAGNELSAARSNEAQEAPIIVPPGALTFTVENSGDVPFRNCRAVFELAL
jgi:hypothetical protein